jgi:hypothetical protein
MSPREVSPSDVDSPINSHHIKPEECERIIRGSLLTLAKGLKTEEMVQVLENAETAARKCMELGLLTSCFNIESPSCLKMMRQALSKINANTSMDTNMKLREAPFLAQGTIRKG